MFHGDPKVNNIMIDDFTGKGTAMIDLDTVSPGLVQIDVGDAVRSICNPAGEEELNLGKVTFDGTLFQAFMKGYMKEAGAFMDAADRAWLYDAVRLLPFELGLRFFQDYLAGDKYFKVRQPGQNLNRARVQFRLCEAIEARERSIRTIFSPCGTHAVTVSPRQAASSSAPHASAAHPHPSIIRFFMFVSFLRFRERLTAAPGCRGSSARAPRSPRRGGTARARG